MPTYTAPTRDTRFIINEVLEPVDVDDERNVARDLVRKKWRSVAGLEPEEGDGERGRHGDCRAV